MAQLYRHFGAGGELLYVGISASALRRLAEHKQVSAWFNEIRTVTIESLPDREAALAAERDAVANEQPKFNVQHKVVRIVKVLEKEQAAASHRTRQELLRVITMRLVWSLQDVANALDVPVSVVEGWIRDGRLGSFMQERNRKDWPPVRRVTGFQLLDFMETLGV